jgi:hypothetical protein
MFLETGKVNLIVGKIGKGKSSLLLNIAHQYHVQGKNMILYVPSYERDAYIKRLRCLINKDILSNILPKEDGKYLFDIPQNIDLIEYFKSVGDLSQDIMYSTENDEYVLPELIGVDSINYYKLDKLDKDEDYSTNLLRKIDTLNKVAQNANVPIVAVVDLFDVYSKLDFKKIYDLEIGNVLLVEIDDTGFVMEVFNKNDNESRSNLHFMKSALRIKDDRFPRMLDINKPEKLITI